MITSAQADTMNYQIIALSVLLLALCSGCSVKPGAVQITLKLDTDLSNATVNGVTLSQDAKQKADK